VRVARTYESHDWPRFEADGSPAPYPADELWEQVVAAFPRSGTRFTSDGRNVHIWHGGFGCQLTLTPSDERDGARASLMLSASVGSAEELGAAIEALDRIEQQVIEFFASFTPRGALRWEFGYRDGRWVPDFAPFKSLLKHPADEQITLALTPAVAAELKGGERAKVAIAAASRADVESAAIRGHRLTANSRGVGVGRAVCQFLYARNALATYAERVAERHTARVYATVAFLFVILTAASWHFKTDWWTFAVVTAVFVGLVGGAAAWLRQAAFGMWRHVGGLVVTYVGLVACFGLIYAALNLAEPGRITGGSGRFGEYFLLSLGVLISEGTTGLNLLGAARAVAYLEMLLTYGTIAVVLSAITQKYLLRQPPAYRESPETGLRGVGF
jgi:hypothetical protein